jgi:hypothetical protein
MNHANYAKNFNMLTNALEALGATYEEDIVPVLGESERFTFKATWTLGAIIATMGRGMDAVTIAGIEVDPLDAIELLKTR